MKKSRRVLSFILCPLIMAFLLIIAEIAKNIIMHGKLYTPFLLTDFARYTAVFAVFYLLVGNLALALGRALKTSHWLLCTAIGLVFGLLVVLLAHSLPSSDDSEVSRLYSLSISSMFILSGAVAGYIFWLIGIRPNPTFKSDV